MGDKKKKTYKETHGTTRIGDFLRSIGKSNILEKVVGAVGEITSGDILGAIQVITKTKELTPAQKEYAIKLAEMDLQEMQEVSKRWESDMASDSWLSKNIRPLSLAYLTFAVTLFIVLESSIPEFAIDDNWVDLLKSLLLAVYVAYFGSRGMEKYGKIKK